ncbi:hypothetical protein ABW20_dc0110198 [Dactylellina cionopaga]|nr:hypothetical protein ABW20_dc0110198 [Dactylellina cionopaga]
MKLEAAYAILALVPSIASHAVFVDAWGDYNGGKRRGYGIGAMPDDVDRDTASGANQRDTAVFASPTIPDDFCTIVSKPSFNGFCTKCLCSVQCKFKGAKRRKAKRTFNFGSMMGGGLGANTPGTAKKNTDMDIFSMSGFGDKIAQFKGSIGTFGSCMNSACPGTFKENCAECVTKSIDKNGPGCRKQLPTGCGRTVYVEQSKYYIVDGKDKSGNLVGSLNTPVWSEYLAKKGDYAEVIAGGTLYTTLHQINQDGAGPYVVLIDSMGNANQWDAKALPTTRNIYGYAGINLFKLKPQPIYVTMPKDLKCTGTYAGLDGFCIVRINNHAANGPFGGCILVRQMFLGQGENLPPQPAFEEPKGDIDPFKPKLKTDEEIKKQFEDDQLVRDAVEEEEKKKAGLNSGKPKVTDPLDPTSDMEHLTEEQQDLLRNSGFAV